jgi:hypothetical protein
VLIIGTTNVVRARQSWCEISEISEISLQTNEIYWRKLIRPMKLKLNYYHYQQVSIFSRTKFSFAFDKRFVDLAKETMCGERK